MRLTRRGAASMGAAAIKFGNPNGCNMKMSSDSIVIGIDLGTTKSCASYYIDGKLIVLENSEGERKTPSLVFFHEPNRKIFFGQDARLLADQKLGHCFYEMKRMLGRGFEDRRVQEKRKYYPFSIAQVDGEPVVLIRDGDDVSYVTPQTLSTLLLEKIKMDVDEAFDSNITKAVITVPACFNSLQRKETLEAAKRAGFTVVKLLNEPNAAALNYYHQNPTNFKKYVLVYDLGGGTFDVSILKKSKTKTSNVEVLCVDGDSHLGGNDFDDLILSYVCVELLNTHNSDVMRKNPRLSARVITKCEEAKRTLSAIDETNIHVDAYVDGRHDSFSIPLSRIQLENMIDGLLKKTLDITARCIDNSTITKQDIGQVILVGGSTRMPKIQTMLAKYFGAGIVNIPANPDGCTVAGAALQAAMLSTHPRQRCENIGITDVVPLSIGCEVIGGYMEFLIRKNTPIPVSVTKSFDNVSHVQDFLEFPIYEGERLDFRRNNRLGEVEMNITPAPPGQCNVNLSLHIDSNGILVCRAEELINGHKKPATIGFYARGIRSDSGIHEAIKNAEKNKAEDEAFRAYSRGKRYLISLFSAMVYNMTDKNIGECHKITFDAATEALHNLKQDPFFYDAEWVENHVKIFTEQRIAQKYVEDFKFEKMPIWKSTLNN